MIYDKAREEMTPRDVTNLEDILKKDNNSILQGERDLLVARRGYLTEDELIKYKIELVGGGYESLKFNDLKKVAKEKGISLSSKDNTEDIIALLNQFDNLQDGDEFQGQIAKIATEEMIKDNELEKELKPGELFFIPKEEDDGNEDGEDKK